MRQKEAGQSLTIVGDGLQRRDFVHVQDVVSANILASESPNCFGNSYNVGTGKMHSIVEIANMISSNSIHIDQRPGEARDTQADSSRLIRDSGWKPEYDLKAWIQNILH